MPCTDKKSVAISIAAIFLVPLILIHIGQDSNNISIGNNSLKKEYCLEWKLLKEPQCYSIPENIPPLIFVSFAIFLTGFCRIVMTIFHYSTSFLNPLMYYMCPSLPNEVEISEMIWEIPHHCPEMEKQFHLMMLINIGIIIYLLLRFYHIIVNLGATAHWWVCRDTMLFPINRKTRLRTIPNWYTCTIIWGINTSIGVYSLHGNSF